MAILPYWQKFTKIGKVKQIGWTAAAPLVLTVLPAGHGPGTYELIMAVIVRVAAGAGNITRSFGYSAPTFGATSIAQFGSTNINTTGHTPASFNVLGAESDGTAAITLTLVPAGVTGSPVLDVYATASLIAPPI